MREYYNYGLRKDVESKRRDGMHRGGYQFTTDQYYSAAEAGRRLGVAPHNVEVVLKFADDNQFRQGPNVAQVITKGTTGGGTQYSHPGRPKPVAKRLIFERSWTPL